MLSQSSVHRCVVCIYSGSPLTSLGNLDASEALIPNLLFLHYREYGTYGTQKKLKRGGVKSGTGTVPIDNNCSSVFLNFEATPSWILHLQFWRQIVNKKLVS